jgi:hypothetical protein
VALLACWDSTYGRIESAGMTAKSGARASMARANPSTSLQQSYLLFDENSYNPAAYSRASSAVMP